MTDEELKEKYEAGATVAELMKETGWARRRIYDHLYKVGTTMRSRSERPATHRDDDTDLRYCSSCEEWKAAEDFSTDSGKRNRRCKACKCADASRHWHRKSPEEKYDFNLRKKYGISLVDYNLLLASQGGGCAICGRSDTRLVVDHDHESGEVRGLLCTKCNTGLGKFDDDTALLRRAINYLSH